jgi:hypothetical protein
MDAISAIEAKTSMYPIHTKKYPHTMPAVPPFSSEKKLVLLLECVSNVERRMSRVGGRAYIKEISHVLMSVQAKPSVEMNRKFRFNC